MRPITLEDVARLPRPGTSGPEGASFSPDGKTLTYLASPEAGGGLARVLWALDLASGAARVLFAPPGGGVSETTVSLQEALRRERQRQLTQGVTSYEWAEDAPVVLVPLNGDLWVIEGDDARMVGTGATDPHISPDGARIAFVRDGDLYVVAVADGTETRLTSDAEPGLTNGLAEFIAQEELGRARGFWWSADGSAIAFEQADERHIPPYVIPHWGREPLTTEEHRYPFAGRENARVRLGVVAASGGPVSWMDLGDFEYVARVAWNPDGRLFVQLLDRAQKRLELRAFDAATGMGETILVEESPHWINLHSDLRFAGNEFVWSSETTGFRRLELRARDGSLVRALTDGTWPVDAVVGFDADGRRVAFVGSPNPLEEHVYIVALDAGEPERLDAQAGYTVASFSKQLDRRVEVHQSRTRPLGVVLRPDDRVLHAPEQPDLQLVTPELFSFENRDGVTLHGALFRPERLPAPLIVWTYGGPHFQAVQDSWVLTADLQAQYLAARGFAVMRVDNRGSSRRGLEFEAALDRALGTVEVADQVDGVRFATAQGWVDGERVGITGWSYGGFMTLMCMLKAPDVFRVGVAGAPVTDQALYDTAYTERYMGTPDENPDGYRGANAIEQAGALKGKLMVIHGMLDENVHFRNTAQFVEALDHAGRSCELLIYPSGRHGLRSEADRRHMHARVVEFFEKNL